MKCYLVCPADTHDPIPLKHGEPLKIGRSPLTRIKDPRCSREQVELIADCKACKVTVKQIAGNSSAVGNNELSKGESAELYSESILYVLSGQYPQVVKFTDNKLNLEEKLNKTDSHNSSKSQSKDTSSNDERKLNQQSKKRIRSSVDSDEVPTKKIKTDLNKKKRKYSDSDDEEHVESVKKKLMKMKEDADKEKNSPKKMTDDVKPKSILKGGKTSSSPAVESRWEQHEKLHVYTKKGVEGRKKIASFDIDGTIITTQSGKRFPTHPGDWKIHYPEIPGRLKKLHNEGYKIVFITNQMGVEKGKTKLEDLKMKFMSLTDKIPAPIQVYLSTGSGWNRKPALGMWRHLAKKANDGVPVSVEDSFYVGDAAGRPEKWAPKKKKDFSCSDRLFALNLGLKFHTPEEFFLDQKKAPFNLPQFDPRKVKSSGDILSPPTAKLILGKQEVVVLVGIPASGKSHFAKKYFVPKNYVYVNRDTLGSWQKCVSACDRALNNGSSVVVDNTNPDPESRKRYIDCAKKNGAVCRCFFLPPVVSHSRHNERFRELVDKTHQPINDMIMNSSVKKMQPPNLSEGFAEVVTINFIAKFDNPEHEKLYKLFLMDK